jgi:uncharacterized protein (DUF1684 family)
MSSISSSYRAELEAWRQEIEVPLRRDWLSLVGRYELQPGQHRLGSDPTAAISLPADSAPDEVGLLTFQDGRVWLRAANGVSLFVNGEPLVGERPLQSDAEAPGPDLVTLGSLSLFIIKRGERTIVRIRDAASPLLTSFGGRRWFPVDEAYRVPAQVIPYDPPKALAITNILGDTSGQYSPARVRFHLGGQEHQLDATGSLSEGLVVHFRDATSGSLTAGGGRVLSSAAPRDGTVILDFNRATNLPCAFTEFATCPLPLPQNRLSIAVQAGEMLP